MTSHIKGNENRLLSKFTKSEVKELIREIKYLRAKYFFLQ